VLERPISPLPKSKCGDRWEKDLPWAKNELHGS
jgi:hypothetical protein